MEPEATTWKAVALASIAISTGLLGILIPLIKRGRHSISSGDNGNKVLLDRLRKIEDIVLEIDRRVAHVEGRLDPTDFRQ